MVFQSQGPISFTKTTLSYPIYAAEFDPYNRGFLVVGGGGGEGRNGVANKITLLDTAPRGSLDTVAELQLSSDEDSVTSLATLASRDGLVTLAGINSSEADQKAGNNEHLRTFEIKYPKRKRVSEKEQGDVAAETGGSIAFAGKTGLFKPATGPKPETYQRLLRLSPVYRRDTPNKRIGAVATGLAKQSEIVVFDATKTPTTQQEVITRIPMRDNVEAADLDITEVEDNTFSIAWATDYDLFEQTVIYNFETGKAEFAPQNPRKVFSMPLREGPDKPPRSKYRAIRWLTEEDVLLLSNLPNRSGAELSIIHLYPSGPAMKVMHKVLPSHVKQAVGLDVCALDSDSKDNKQIIVAIASHDISIPIYTLEYHGLTRTFGPFKNFTTLRDVHPLQMTSLRFSNFHSPVRAPPPNPEDKEKKVEKPVHPGPQYIKLCSTSMGNTVVVETLALSPLNPARRNTRYVLAHPSDETRLRTIYLFLGSFIAIVAAILLQSLFASPDSKSLISYIPLPGSVKAVLDRPASFKDSVGRGGREIISEIATPIQSTLVHPGAKISELLNLHAALPGGPPSAEKAVIVRDDGGGEGEAGNKEVSVSVAGKDEYLARDKDARGWHELDEVERRVWRGRLVEAGRWAEHEGEAVLKGVLFSSWAGFVGRVAADGLREL